MESFDITIIGAGVIGLSIAAEVTRDNRTVLILEKNHSWGQETSSRNSEVIHAGIYYPKNSLKAVSCVEGRKMLYDLCPKKNIGIKKTGKLIVAACEDEIPYLESLQKKAADNGVELEFLDKTQVQKLEPYITCFLALHSPETGLVDSHQLMKSFLDKAVSKGADLVCEAEVVGIAKTQNAYQLTIHNQGEELNVSSRVVINCAGHNADSIAALAGIDVDRHGYRQYYLKGNYFRLSDKYRGMTQRLIYPVPNENSLGIHTVLDLQGGIRVGPDEEEVQDIDYRVPEARRKNFYAAAKRFFPAVREHDLTPDMAGIRPQLRKPNLGTFRDFIISHEDNKGLAGLINLIGIESPGLTSAPFIARYVAKIVDQLA